jgi:hypothetical protein
MHRGTHEILLMNNYYQEIPIFSGTKPVVISTKLYLGGSSDGGVLRRRRINLSQ